jgi:hypothetical protein
LAYGAGQVAGKVTEATADIVIPAAGKARDSLMDQAAQAYQSFEREFIGWVNSMGAGVPYY